MCSILKNDSVLLEVCEQLLAIEDDRLRTLGMSYLFECVHWKLAVDSSNHHSYDLYSVSLAVCKAFVSYYDSLSNNHSKTRHCEKQIDLLLNRYKGDAPDMVLQRTIGITCAILLWCDEHYAVSRIGNGYVIRDHERYMLKSYIRTHIDLLMLIKYKNVSSLYDSCVMWNEEMQYVKRYRVMLNHTVDSAKLEGLKTLAFRSLWIGRFIASEQSAARDVGDIIPYPQYINVASCMRNTLMFINGYISKHKTFSAILDTA